MTTILRNLRMMMPAILTVIAGMLLIWGVMFLITILWNLLTRPGEHDFRRGAILTIALSVVVGAAVGMIIHRLITYRRVVRWMVEATASVAAADIGSRVLDRRYRSLVDQVARRTGFVSDTLHPDKLLIEQKEHLRAIGISL